LTQYDRDGESQKSSVVSAIFRGGSIELTKKMIEGDQMTLSYNIAVSEEYTLTALDITGKVITQQQLNLTEGLNDLTMDIPNNGVIVVILENGLDQNIEKVFK